ncbi:LytR family transcriptional regulator [Streptococcus sp. X16XC17]|uniref:LCP family protein n=1 Tax=unclassified Streptococcus TaxID=2608887 RepID=UPI00066FD078|nr:MULTISPECIES: LCP family protein [unclassified Streptococcus]TCD46450.1 LytR family transcriptional regulator [Streptococcus sp. X16XC17]
MKRNDSHLSHHEELRLDYLQKNIYYLNDKEKRELAFLKYKAQGYATNVAYPHPNKIRQPKVKAIPQEEPAWVDDVPYYGEEEDDLFGVPDYPTQTRTRSRKSAKKPRRPKVATQPIMVEENLVSSYKKQDNRPKKPRKKGGFKRFIRILGLLLVAVLAGMIFMFVKGFTGGAEGNSKAAEAEVFHGENTRDGVNILVLGTDGRIGDSSDMTRTDSIMVININNTDKKVKMVSFMRDTLINIEGNDYKLNVAYTFGEQNNHQGAENVRQVLKENFDLDIKHYALVDFSTFATAIDTLFPEGVTMNAQFSTIGGQDVSEVDVPDDLNMKDGIVPNQTIEEGIQQMDGRTLLNYARFRKDDEGDYGRTRRQQEVMAAVLSQIKDPTKLFTGSEALGKVFSLTSTSVPYSFLLTNGITAALDGTSGIETTTIPENNDWAEEYDVYGGSGIKIDFEKYKAKLSDMGFR